MGEAGNVVCIFANTYIHSLEYWKENHDKWAKLFQDYDIKDKISSPTVNPTTSSISMNEVPDETDVDRSTLNIVFSDAAGAVIGGTHYTVDFYASGGAEYSTMFGPEGVVIGTSGAAITGGIIGGIEGSLSAAGVSYTISEWF